MSFRTVSVYVCFLLISVLLISSQIPFLADDPGLGWHLRSGLDILQNQEIPYTDLYLGVLTSKRWVADQWLGSVLLASIYEFAGWKGLYLGASCLFLLTLCMFWLSFLETYTGRICISMYVVCICLKLGLLQFVIRPVLFSYLFFAIFIAWLIVMIKRIRNGAVLERRDWVLGGVGMIVWAQIHPYFILVPIAFCLVALGMFIELFVLEHRFHVRSLLSFCFVYPAVLLLLTIINPYGIFLHESILLLGSSDFLTNLMSEWQALTLYSSEGQLFVVALILAALGYVNRVMKEGELFVSELVLALGFIYFAVNSVRAVPLAALILSPWMVWGIAACADLEWFKKFPSLRTLKSSLQIVQVELRSRVIFSIGCCVLAFWATLSFFGATAQLPEVLGPSLEKYPYGAIRFIDGVILASRKEKVSAPLVILNDPNWGGFITFSLHPDAKPLLDDRLTLREETIYRNYKEEFLDGKDVKKFLSRHRADLLLIPTDSVANQDLVVNHKPIYQDEKSVVYSLPLRTETKEMEPDDSNA